MLESLEVQAQPSEVCVVDGDGEKVECFSSRAQADTFLAGVQVGPKEDVAERLRQPFGLRVAIVRRPRPGRRPRRAPTA